MHIFDQDGINVLHRPLFASAKEGKNVSGLLARLHAGTLTGTEIVDAAAKLRRGKHRVLTLTRIEIRWRITRDVEDVPGS